MKENNLVLSTNLRPRDQFSNLLVRDYVALSLGSALLK